MQTKSLAQLTKNDVLRTYSGRPGCMCGCLGHYKYNPDHLEEAKVDAGQAAMFLGEEDFSGRSVSIVLKKLQALIACNDPGTKVFYDDHGRWVSAQDERHSYTAYLRPGVECFKPSDEQALNVHVGSQVRSSGPVAAAAFYDLTSFDPSKI